MAPGSSYAGGPRGLLDLLLDVAREVRAHVVAGQRAALGQVLRQAPQPEGEVHHDGLLGLHASVRADPAEDEGLALLHVLLLVAHVEERVLEAVEVALVAVEALFLWEGRREAG